MWGNIMNFYPFEEILNKIDGVINAKIVVENDCIIEVHVLANCTRSPKQIVRDIESSLFASFNYKIDRKIISIAQIKTDAFELNKRIKFNGVSNKTNGNVLECSVSLLYDDGEYSEATSCVKTASNMRKIVAKSTIKSVEKILGQDTIFDIQDVLLTSSRDISFVSVLVNIIVDDRDEVVIGSAIIKQDVNEAIAKATLDAVNRRVQKNIY